MPFVRVAGKPMEKSVSASFVVDGRAMHLRPLLAELQLTYVHGLLAPEEIDELVRLADARSGWARSPVKAQGSGTDIYGDALRSAGHVRNSSTCSLLWPLAYASRIQDIQDRLGDRAAPVLAELALVSRLTQRVGDLLKAAGLPVSDAYIEPLQLLRYAPSEVFTLHHDYHKPDAQGWLGSSIQGEQRAYTVFLFGTTLPEHAGGETYFPDPKIAVSPRKGDAVFWANVGPDGQPNPRSLHEGRPPRGGQSKIAINCFVADRPFDLSRGMAGAVGVGR